MNSALQVMEGSLGWEKKLEYTAPCKMEKNLEKVKVEACLSHEVAVEKTRNQGAEG